MHKSSIFKPDLPSRLSFRFWLGIREMALAVLRRRHVRRDWLGTLRDAFERRELCFKPADLFILFLDEL